MALVLRNPALFNAAYAGCYAALMTPFAPTDAARAAAGLPPQDYVAATYAEASNIAVAFATEVDSQIANVANLSLANATVPPTTAVEAATTNALVSLMTKLSEAQWSSRGGSALALDDITSADYLNAAKTVAAQFSEAQTAFAANGTLV